MTAVFDEITPQKMNSTAEIDKKLEQLTSKIKKITEFVEKVFEKGPEKDRNELIHDELTRKEYLLKDKEYLLTKKEYLLKEKELQGIRLQRNS